SIFGSRPAGVDEGVAALIPAALPFPAATDEGFDPCVVASVRPDTAAPVCRPAPLLLAGMMEGAALPLSLVTASPSKTCAGASAAMSAATPRRTLSSASETPRSARESRRRLLRQH